MATTTTNFGFDVPTSSDLVKNGATQIALLGQDIDTFLDGSPTRTAAKNFVINGNFNISQRGTSFVNPTASYGIDMWNNRNNNLGAFTVSQDTDAPAGFKTSAKWLVTTADASPAASDFAIFRTNFEGQALQSLCKGTASAKSVTISFWVKSNTTGTYILNLSDLDNSRQISKSYTISASATWEKKSITFEGDTTGTLDNDNASSFTLQFFLGVGTDRSSGTLQTTWATTVNANAAVGQTNLAATLNNYWQVTGVQMEIGSTVTPFQTASGTIQGELALCQRYYWRTTANVQYLGTGTAKSATVADFVIQYPQTMRVAPTMSANTGTTYFGFDTAAVLTGDTTIGNFYDPSNIRTLARITTSGLTTGQGGIGQTRNASAYVEASAEL